MRVGIDNALDFSIVGDRRTLGFDRSKTKGRDLHPLLIRLLGVIDLVEIYILLLVLVVHLPPGRVDPRPQQLWVTSCVDNSTGHDSSPLSHASRPNTMAQLVHIDLNKPLCVGTECIAR